MALRTENLSIRTKIVMMLCATALLTLFFVVTALTLYEKQSVKKNLMTELASIADVMGLNNGAALLFSDDQTAKENLSFLAAKPSIATATLFDQAGIIRASYHRNTSEFADGTSNVNSIDPQQIRDQFPQVVQSKTIHFFEKKGYLHIIRPIHSQNMLMGYIHLVDDMQTLSDRLISYYKLLGVVVLITFLFVLIMASKLQRLFTEPLFKLMHSMESVTSEKNYSLKMPEGGKDEFGILMSHFNKMLHEIQSRDQALQNYSTDLEKRVAMRTTDLSQAKMALEKTVKDLEAAKNSAEAANQAKSRFLANMSHEIRTPMNSVLGFLTLTLEDESLPDHHKEHLAIAHKSANSLLVLLNEILDLSKIESGKHTIEEKPFSLKRMLVNIIEPLAVKAKEKKLALTYELSTGSIDMVMGDFSHVSQILTNLIQNAIKFTEKGAIAVNVTLPPPDASLQLPQSQAQDDNTQVIPVRFSISDTGIGIPQDRLDTLFDAFTQADGSTTRRYGGSGLGAAVAKQLVVLMGGKIWVESSIGEGSTFYFIIPFKAVSDRTQSISLPLSTEQTTRNKTTQESVHDVGRILIVDDIPENIRLITLYLKRQNFFIETCQSAPEAIELLDQERFDLILMDIHMPQMDGVEATRHIREHEKEKGYRTPIVAVTASVMSDEIARYFEVGMDGVVQKPIKFKQLDTVINGLLAPFENSAVFNAKTSRYITEERSVAESLFSVDASHDNATPKLNENDLQHVKEALEKLKSACCEYSPDATEPFILTLRQMIDPSLIKPLQKKIEMFDFDGVIDEVDQLVKTLCLNEPKKLNTP